jgi:hypothetical protein
LPLKADLLRYANVLLISSAASWACHAESFVSSTVSAGSASLGSSSQSVQTSSNSASGEKKVADGAYRVIDVAVMPERPGRPELLRVQLQLPGATGQDAPATLQLELPRQALATRGLVVGELVNVRNRPYGLEFAHAATHEPFFLALNDDWRSDLQTRAVKL